MVDDVEEWEASEEGGSEEQSGRRSGIGGERGAAVGREHRVPPPPLEP